MGLTILLKGVHDMKKKRNKKPIYILIIIYLVILISMLIVLFPAVSDAIMHDVFRYMSAESLLIIFLVIIVCITMLILAMLTIYNKNNRDTDNGTVMNIKIDEERSYLERQIAELNEKLVSTDERWREAYHLIMTSQRKQIDGNGIVSITKFLEGFGIDIDEIKIQADLAFVLMPFHRDFINTYEIINEICSKAKMHSMKGDEEFVPKDVLQHIIKCIVKSRIVIANLNGRNPNVFYELGIAHALNKPTILIAHVDTEVPFDLKNKYLVLYNNDNELRERLFDALLKVMTRTE